MSQVQTHTLEKCPRCNYARAQKTKSQTGQQEHFICFRCGYVRLTNDGVVEEYNETLGCWMYVVKRGVAMSAAYLDERSFFAQMEEFKKKIKDGKLFYSKADGATGYVLVDLVSMDKYPFGDNHEVCYEGLKDMDEKF